MVTFQEVELREVMRRWVTGVAILTSGSREVRHGMTVSSLTSISVQPPLVAITMSNSTRTKHLVDETEFFAINLLSEGQQALADRFAGRMSDSEDRFHDLQIFYGECGAPMLTEAAAWLECKVVHKYEMPETTLYVGEVLNAHKAEDRPPLVYFNRDYHRIV